MNQVKALWKEMLRQARLLRDDELIRHARVSTSNRHACTSCFCCACEVERIDRLVRSATSNHSRDTEDFREP